MNIEEEFRRNLIFFRRIRNADDIIVGYLDVPAKDGRVNLHVGDWGRSGWDYYNTGERPCNLGDYLAVPIVEYFLGKRGISLDQPVQGKRHLFTVGSSVLYSFANATMWGSGVEYDGLNGTRWWAR